MAVNVLWPFVPAAIAVRYARPHDHVWIFALNYIAMVPSANLIGFAGQELARKLPKVFGRCQALATADTFADGERCTPGDLPWWHRRNRSLHGPSAQEC